VDKQYDLCWVKDQSFRITSFCLGSRRMQDISSKMLMVIKRIVLK